MEASSGVGFQILAPLREQITATDLEIIRLLGIRRRLVLQVGDVKRLSGMEVRDKVREANLLQILIPAGEKEGLPKEYVESLYRTIIEHSVSAEKDLLK